MDKIERLLGIGLSPEQAEKAAGIFEEGGEAEKLRDEVGRLSEENLKQAEELKRLGGERSEEIKGLRKQLDKSAVEIKVLEELYKAGAKNPRFIMGAMGCEGLKLGGDGEVVGLADRVGALKASDPYLFSDNAFVLEGFQPEQAGDFSPDGKGDFSEMTYSEMVDRLM